eukprot:TRINITY_DN2899_c0_g1_i1.p1 TRINITY_DN2899_c0_g1~~TRINITY_DN2899_c0_g1_i1.p1  ORF type:complete len:235 (-),score=72.71 TRINITY_DN2899_c0_g1_i1:632-1336(-)
MASSFARYCVGTNALRNQSFGARKSIQYLQKRNISQSNNRSKIFVLGRGDHGQLGLGPHKTETNGEWIKMGAKGVKKMWTGPNHAFIQDHDGKLWGWGEEENGQLLSKEDLFEPKVIQDSLLNNANISFISCGSHHSLCALQSPDGNGHQLFGWGSNQYGELGLKELNEKVNQPQEITFFSGKTITALSCGEDFSVVATTEGVYSFGRDDMGQLGRVDKKEEEKKPFRFKLSQT